MKVIGVEERKEKNRGRGKKQDGWKSGGAASIQYGSPVLFLCWWPKRGKSNVVGSRPFLSALFYFFLLARAHGSVSGAATGWD